MRKRISVEVLFYSELASAGLRLRLAVFNYIARLMMMKMMVLIGLGGVEENLVASISLSKALSFVRRPLADFPCRVTVALLPLRAAEIDFCYLCRTRLAIHVL